MSALLALPQRAPRLTLLVWGLLTVILAYCAGSLSVDWSPTSLLPADEAEQQYYEQVRAQFGNEQVTVIGVFAADVFAPATLAKIDAVSQQVASLDGVREVISLTTVKGVEMTDFGLRAGRLLPGLPQTVAAAAAFRRTVMASPVYVKNVVSADATAASITVVFEPISDAERARRGLDDRIDAIVASIAGPEQFAVSGLPIVTAMTARVLRSNLSTVTPLATLVVALVLLWGFRDARAMRFGVVGLPLLWTVGLMGLAGIRLTLGTVMLMPLLAMTMIAFATNAVTLSGGLSKAALALLVGFCCFALSSETAVRQLGTWMAAAVAITICTIFTFVPAARFIFGKMHQPAQPGEPSEWRLPRRRAIQRASLLLAAIAAVGLIRLRIDTDFLRSLARSSQARSDDARLVGPLGGAWPLYVVVEGAAPQSFTRLETLRAVRRLQDVIDRQPGVDKTLSLLDYLALVRAVLQPDTGPMPATQNDIDQILALANPADMKSAVSRDFSRGTILVRTQLSRSADVLELVQRVSDCVAGRLSECGREPGAAPRPLFPPDVRVRPTGFIVLLSRAADALTRAQIGALWRAAAAIALVAVLLYRSMRIGLAVLLAMMVPVAVLFGVMGWAGIALDFATGSAAVIAMVFGVSNATGGHGERTTRSAVIALVLGFLMFGAAQSPEVQEIGLACSVAVAVAWLTSFIIPTVPGAQATDVAPRGTPTV